MVQHEMLILSSGFPRACVSLIVVWVFIDCLHHFKIMLLLLLLVSMARQTTQSCSDHHPLTRHLQTSTGTYVPEEANWRAFMSKLPSKDEAEWRDANSKAIVGTVLQVRLLAQDGSISQAFLEMDLSPPPQLDILIADAHASENVALEKLKDVVPCKESLQDGLPPTEPCLVKVPSRYARQYKWPHSQLKRDGTSSKTRCYAQARVQNVAHSPLLKSRRSAAWVHVNASTIVFSAGGPLYPKGADSYLDHLMQLVPELGVGSTTRVALDVECGTGSLSRAMGMRGVTTLCLSAYDSPENGVQLVMERGFPALLSHTFDSSGQPHHHLRLPFPNQAFDLLHCAACNVPWPSHDGALLFEADRILRSGGFFVWIMDGSNQEASWSEMAIQAEKLCWKLMIRNYQLTVWQKLVNITSVICSNHTHVPLCSETKSKWKVGMKACLENADDNFKVEANWTSRLMNPPKRLKIIQAGGLQRAKQEVFISDFNYWVYVTDYYVRSLGSTRVGEIRNVLDVNAGYGSFAAALALRTPPLPWWVLNVVPVDQPDRLPLLFDRGLLGIYHDWCEPLDSYARTFDLVHASRFFSKQHKCSAQVILLEIDRLLRPGGFVLFRDQKETLLSMQTLVTKVLHWKAHIDDTESGKWGTDKLLHCQKTRWTKP